MTRQPGVLLGASGAFTFVLSALKLPSVTGSCSHPTGTGLGAIFFRPPVMTVLGTVTLLFQALLLAPGGPRIGRAEELLADVPLWEAARLRRPWGTAVDGMLRAHGRLAGDAAGPRTARELAEWPMPR